MGGLNPDPADYGHVVIRPSNQLRYGFTQENLKWPFVRPTGTGGKNYVAYRLGIHRLPIECRNGRIPGARESGENLLDKVHAQTDGHDAKIISIDADQSVT